MIETRMIDRGEIVHFKIIGKYVVSEIAEAVRSVYPKVRHGVIWDISQGEISDMSSKEMMELAKNGAKYAVHKKTAFVGGEDLKYGVLRMYETYAEINQVPTVMKVFRTLEEALQWCREDA